MLDPIKESDPCAAGEKITLHEDLKMWAAKTGLSYDEAVERTEKAMCRQIVRDVTGNYEA